MFRIKFKLYFLILFRNIAVDTSSTSVALSITRAQGTNGRVTVSYITSMLPEKYTENDLVINRAIENKDYTTTQGVLVFEHGKVRETFVKKAKRTVGLKIQL